MSCSISPSSGSTSSTQMKTPVSVLSSSEKSVFMRVRQFAGVELSFSHEMPPRGATSMPVSRRVGLGLVRWVDDSRSLCRMSSSMPGAEVTCAEIQPCCSACRERYVSRAVFPAPRAPTNREQTSGLLPFEARAAAMSPIICSRPAMKGGTLPNTGVNGLVRTVSSTVIECSSHLMRVVYPSC